jgi:hypothetical protein
MNFRRTLGLIGSACIGAGIMYLADPRMGRRRRARIRDRFGSADKKVRRFISSQSADVKNRAYGIFCEAKKTLIAS